MRRHTKRFANIRSYTSQSLIALRSSAKCDGNLLTFIFYSGLGRQTKAQRAWYFIWQRIYCESDFNLLAPTRNMKAKACRT
jgi:hypothetical protein